MKIITLTLSPAFDLHCTADELQLGRENLAHICRREVGGKGVNISRALKTNEKDSLCIVLLGDANGEEFKKGLERDSLNFKVFNVSGRIRENITIHTKGGEETRISFEGASAEPSVLDTIAAELERTELSDTLITFTGRAPEGISIEHIKAFLKRLQELGARVIIDSRSFSLSDIADCTPYLIKPNEEEISTYMGRDISTLAEAVEAGRTICKMGVENVMITLGGKGAVLVTCDGVWTATPPRLTPLSTIGAGDSTIAGFLSAIAEGQDISLALRRAVAYGSAACLTEGTQPPRQEDIENLISQVEIKAGG